MAYKNPEARRAYRAANLEKVRARDRAYRAANLEKVRARKRTYDAAYRAANLEKVRAQERTYDAAYRAANLEKVRAQDRAWYAANLEKVRARKQAWYAANLEKVRARERRGRGLPEPARPEPDRCECCGRPPRSVALNLDHCHETGAFRGWLCMLCNTGIGKLGDNISGLKAAIAYLERTGSGP